MDVIKFSKNITDKQAESINLEKASELLENVHISNFEVKQNANQSWKVYGHKRHDTDQALIALFEEATGNMWNEKDSEKALLLFIKSKLCMLAKEKLIINLQASYRDLMMITLGMGAETKAMREFNDRKERLITNLTKRGLSSEDIQDVIRETF